MVYLFKLNPRILMVWVVFLIALYPGIGVAGLYTVKSNVNLRKGPALRYQVVEILNHNQSLTFLKRTGDWLCVRTPSGQEGFVRHDMVSDTWINIHKKERRLMVLKGSKTLKTYRIGLCPFNPLGDKERLGDGGTPEGRFFICDMVREPRSAKYGSCSMLLSYPGVESARKGLKKGLINYATYKGIVRSVHAGRTPNQGTPLGGSIRIHGGGGRHDWTLGCIALDDGDALEVLKCVGKGTRVDIYKSAQHEIEFNTAGHLNRQILKGAKRQILKPALYTSEACGIIPLAYPMGDIRPQWAVCTDVVIRGLRDAGLDLQALVHEDTISFPERYKRWIKKPDPNIDHRRTRNLRTYFVFHSRVLPNDGDFQPGDIVIMDTGIPNGTLYDHIGIVDNKTGPHGFLKVINIWTIGYRTSSMNILGSNYPSVVGHFRMTNPFDYQ